MRATVLVPARVVQPSVRSSPSLNGKTRVIFIFD